MIAAILRSTIVHIASAFLVMGAWGIYANHEHGAAAALRAGLVQGTASAILMAFLKRSLESLFARFRGLPLRRVLPWAISCLVVALSLALFHLIAETPNILATIAVPLSASTTYAIIYTATLPSS